MQSLILFTCGNLLKKIPYPSEIAGILQVIVIILVFVSFLFKTDPVVCLTSKKHEFYEIFQHIKCVKHEEGNAEPPGRYSGKNHQCSDDYSAGYHALHPLTCVGAFMIPDSLWHLLLILVFRTDPCGQRNGVIITPEECACYPVVI